MSENIEIKQSHEVVIGEKDTVFSAIALTKTPQGTFLGRFDARFDPQIMRSPCQSPELGDQLFDSSIQTSIENGWKLSYRGGANWG